MSIADEIIEAFTAPSSKAANNIGKQTTYNPQKSQIEETANIDKILTTFRIECERRSEKIEKTLIKYSRNDLDSYIDYLKKFGKQEYNNKLLNVDLERLNRQHRKTEDMINGYIKRRIQKSVSLDDPRCLSILEMKPSKAKQQEMNSYLQSIIKTCTLDLTDELAKSMKSQSESTLKQIKQQLDDESDYTERKIQMFHVLEKKLNTEGDIEEKNLSKFYYKLGLLEIGESLLK